MKNIILSLLFWVVASACMAITLPKSYYSADMAYTSENESYVSSIGSKFINYSTLGTYTNECDSYREGGEQWTGDISECNNCCNRNFPSGVDRDGRSTCFTLCTVPLGMPLDTPVAFMLAIVLSYSAFMLYRKRKASEQV